MLTREQKAWLVTGFCNTFDRCDTDCPLNKQCASSFCEFDDFTVAQLDECLKIIAPELVDTPKPAAAPQWISIKDKLPESGVEVLTRDAYGNLRNRSLYVFNNATRVVVFWTDGLVPGKRIPHWMPLPEPPEVERK